MMKILPLFLGLLLLPCWAVAQGDTSDEAETIEKILALQRQIDELIAGLTPEARARLSERLAAAPTQSPEAVAPPPAASPPIAAAEAPESTTVASPPVTPPERVAVTPPPPPAEPEPRPVRRRSRRPQCNFLDHLDSNEDGRISSHDRYWRHLYLWADSNGDGQVQDGEVESAYELDVREISVNLDTFVRKKGNIGEIRVTDRLVFDTGSDGFGGADDRVLVVEASKIKRGTGPEIFSASGESLEGYQPFQEGWRIKQDGGESTVLACP